MRRYIISPATVLTLETLDGLPELKPDEVMVRMRAASLNFRDHLIISGMYPLPLKDEVVPVSDGAGEIQAVGSAVTGLAPGDRVVSTFFPDWDGGEIDLQRISRALGGSADGVLADYAVLPARAVLPFPDHLSFEQAATLPCAGVTAWNAVMEVGKIKAGDVVLLQGTGGVSSFALQFAKLAGATVIQTSSSDEKLAAAQQRGADYLINYRNTPEWDVEARRITHGRGVDLVVEVGGAGTLERSLRATRLGGRIAGVGLVTGLGNIDPLPVLTGVVHVSGVLVGSHDMYRAMSRAIQASGMEPLIDRTFSFDEVPAAYAYLAEGAAGKVVIRF